MKAIRLTVKNIGIIADAVIELNKPLILFYGEIRQGKTTLLNSVKWVFGGTFPTDIIRTGETEAVIKLDLDCGSISRSFYVGKDGTTKSRALKFERDGVEVRDPVAEIKKFLNPFLLDQSYLAAMTELERKKYFAGLFSVNTADIDSAIAATTQKAEVTRSKLKAYGDIDLTVVEPPANILELQQARASIIANHQVAQGQLHGELAARREANAAAQREVNLHNAAVRENNFHVETAVRESARLSTQISQMEAELVCLRSNRDNKVAWLKEHPLQVERANLPIPDNSDLEKQLGIPPDTSVVDDQLRAAEGARVRYQAYQASLGRQKEREADEALLLSLDATTRELRAKRLAKLQELSDSTGIPGLKFDEAGNFEFEGCTAGMLSTSQIMRLSSMLSALYPEGFGIELLDRGESLGKAIFEFIDRAREEQKTILATIVGEKPAQVPEDAGVFVVTDGRVA
jgi:hypothetical protein